MPTYDFDGHVSFISIPAGLIVGITSLEKNAISGTKKEVEGPIDIDVIASGMSHPLRQLNIRYSNMPSINVRNLKAEYDHVKSIVNASWDAPDISMFNRTGIVGYGIQVYDVSKSKIIGTVNNDWKNTTATINVPKQSDLIYISVGVNISGDFPSNKTEIYQVAYDPAAAAAADAAAAAAAAAAAQAAAAGAAAAAAEEARLNPGLFIDTLTANSKGLGSFTLRWRNPTINITRVSLAAQSSEYTITQPQIRRTYNSSGVEVIDYYCVITSGPDGFKSKLQVGVGSFSFCVGVYLYSGSSVICVQCALPTYGFKCAQINGVTLPYNGTQCVGNLIGPLDDSDGNITPTAISVATIDASRINTALVPWECVVTFMNRQVYI